jgi:glycerol-3-phosphate dehydrogenase
MVSVAGGKLTTYRRIALDALDHLGVRGLSKRPRPLPGATGLERIAWPVDLDTPTRNHLLHLYGSLAPEVLAPALDDPSLLEPLVPGRPDLRAEALYARTHEWARTDEDVLRRRTTAWVGAQPGLGQVAAGSERLQPG